MTINPTKDDTTLEAQFEAIKKAYSNNPFPTYQERRQYLKNLKYQLQRYQDLITTAIAEDFGWRAPMV